jgi:hypothetical protein
VARTARDAGVDILACAVITGAFARETPLESILRSHALAHAAEGDLYQRALLKGAEAQGLEPPWAEDQKLAALAAWIALARSSTRAR